MPRVRDADRTRRSILDAAAIEICARGPAGARIDSIAAAAGINKRMLYHYFGSKDGLLGAAFADRLESPDREEASSMSAALIADHQRMAERPDEVRLLMWEALGYAGGEVAGHAERADVWRSRVDQISADTRGADRPTHDVQAAQLQLTLAAIALFPFAFPQLTRLITGRLVGEKAFLDARVDHLAKIAALFEAKPLSAAGELPKPRFRLAASVTEAERSSEPDQRAIEANTSK